MNVYVESNFVLELALLQEQQAACAEILRICEGGGGRLVLPAYSLMEPYETLGRRQTERKQLKAALDGHFRQIARTAEHSERLNEFESMTSLLVDSAEREIHRLEDARFRLLKCGELIALDGSILARASGEEVKHGLTARDAVVYASILVHLEQSADPGCFLSRDSDFDDPNIRRELKDLRCKFLGSFESGLQYIRSLSKAPA